MVSICLLTTARPSTNPRLVKEADALAEAGYRVHVLGTSWPSSWSDAADQELLSRRKWTYTSIGGHKATQPWYYHWTRVRHVICRRLLRVVPSFPHIQEQALCRVRSELEWAARDLNADLYIAHNLGALPAAAAAARKHHTLFGYDAEDFHSEMDTGGIERRAAQSVERRFLPQCAYVTAATPGVADAYAEKYQMVRPITILNVFPLVLRPPRLRVTATTEPLTLYWFSQTIGRNRGIEDAIRAMSLLDPSETELHLRGTWQAGYENELMSFAANCGVSPKRVHGYPPGPPDEMIRLASEYDVGLALEQRSSRNNDLAISNKLFTYLLGGNAIAATATTGQRAIMKQVGAAGFCYEPGHIEALAAGLRNWYDNRSALQTSRRESWEWGTRRFNWEYEKKAFLQLVEQVLGKGRFATPLASLS